MCKYRVVQEKGFYMYWNVQKKVLGIWWNIKNIKADGLGEAEKSLKKRYLNRKVSKEYEC